MGALQFVSVLLEVAILVVCLMAVYDKKRKFAAGFIVTYAVYVFYDIARALNFNIPELWLEIIFFIGTFTALLSMTMIYKMKK